MLNAEREEWFAVVAGLSLIVLAICQLVQTPKPSSWLDYAVLLVGLFCLTGLVAFRKLKEYFVGFTLIFALAVAAKLIAKQELIAYAGLAYAIWALLFGLLIRNVLRKTPSWIQTAAKTELFIKTGLVLLGAEILFSVIVSAGTRSIFEVTIGLALVWYVCYYLAVRFGLKKSLAAIMANATSVCGVSAAIAAGGAVKGNKREISHVVSLVLLFSTPMIVLMPMLASFLGLPDAVAGAWIGGTIDNTASVVASGALYSEEAMAIASVVKLSQNVLIGVTAFLLALYWVVKVERNPAGKPKLREIWYRFPKFIIGFMLASLLFSFVLLPTMGSASVKNILKVTKGFRGWFFALTFVSIGLTTDFKELVKVGKGKPFLVFLLVTVWDVVITFVSAWWFFG